jgi:hypothetical protein
MEKKNHIQPSIEDGTRRIKLYNDLSKAMRDLSRKEKRQVLSQLDMYVKQLAYNQTLEKRLSLVYSLCTCYVFDFLYKAGQLSADNNHFHPVIRKHINDILITLANDYETD